MRKFKLRWALVPLALLLMAAVIDLVVCNAGLLFAERGTYSVAAATKRETAEDGSVTTTMTIKPEGYIHKITLSTPRNIQAGFLGYGVYIKKPDMELIHHSTEYLPPYELSKDTVSIRTRAKEIEFWFQQEVGQVEFLVDNTIALSKRRIGVWYAGLLCGWLLFELRKRIGSRLELAFLAIACTLGLAFATLMPAAVSLSFDDRDHMARAYDLTYAHDGSREQRLVDIMQDRSIVGDAARGTAHPFNTTEDNTRYYAWLSDDSTVQTDLHPNRAGAFYDVGYAGQALGLWVTRVLGLPLEIQLIVGRVGNLLPYIFLCYWAIRLAKRYKAIFFVVALGPIALFTAGSYSSDPTVNSCALLGISLFLSELLTPDRLLSRPRGLAMLAALVACAMPKAIYGVLLVLPLMLPAGKFGSQRQRRQFKGCALAALVLVLASFILPALLGVSEHSDVRVEGTGVSEQIGFMLQHPLTAIGIFLEGIFSNLQLHLLSMQLWFPHLSIWMNPFFNAIAPAMSILFFGLLLFVAFTDRYKDEGIVEVSRRQRLVMLGVMLAGVLLVWASMYLSFTPVGSAVIHGVQGRYYIPLLPLAAVLLNMRGQSGGMEAGKYNLSIAGMSGAGLFLMLTVLCVVNFWL